MEVQQQVIAEIAREVVSRLRAQMQPSPASAASRPAVAATRPSNGAAAAAKSTTPALGDGIFATVDEAVNAAYEAQKKVEAMSLADRKRLTDIIVRICNDRREELGKMEMDETKVGRLDHKIQKLTNMRFVLSVDAMRSDARSDSTGLCIIERAPWGVIGMM
ncbi:MAG: aldehyde dehydrogenase family protein, partial [Terracidiphilus sp.]